jgi:hypothetical protein
MRHIRGAEVAFARVDAVLCVPVVIEEVARGVREHESREDKSKGEQKGEAETGVKKVEETAYDYGVGRHDENNGTCCDQPTTESVEPLNRLRVHVVGAV